MELLVSIKQTVRKRPTLFSDDVVYQFLTNFKYQTPKLHQRIVVTKSELFHVLKTVKGMMHLVPSRTPQSSGYGVWCTCGLCYMLDPWSGRVMYTVVVIKQSNKQENGLWVWEGSQTEDKRLFQKIKIWVSGKMFYELAGTDQASP
jgi:hypothetical protein